MSDLVGNQSLDYPNTPVKTKMAPKVASKMFFSGTWAACLLPVQDDIGV